ncbi:RecQ-mediated genome instability protein [Aspergillus bombycis]|uniref:RecQ-mediated genome instability protein 1 n=1 Tax=Aspergillus bombycis TaxID=109264 RepID=A0A1F7ZXW7_9EURO|nr:RecQ-mediated genome instability protein [Aspergillus bombycis]OGM43915.1 RecQ-mediated genome instability protein [Aspergillus bombycis]
MANPEEQIAAQLLSSKSLPVSAAWLSNFLTSIAHQRNVPLSAVTQTALFRILASDFRDSLSTRSPSSLLPVDIFDPTVQERRLQGVIPVQVLDIEDIGASLWSQVEAIERVERGEAIRGREIVRTINVDEDPEQSAGGAGGNPASAQPETGNSNGPHRVVVQDAAGTKAVAIELKHVSGIALGKLPIGAKLVLRNATVARGMVLLTPESVTLLGGKIDSLDQTWREGRKERLIARITETQGEQ